MLLDLNLGWIEPGNGSNTTTGESDADGALGPTITFEYVIADRFGIERLAPWPSKHDLDLDGNDIGETRHLPPTLSLKYYFTNKSCITPFVGAAINYTYFFDEEIDGVDVGKVEIDPWVFNVACMLRV